MRTCSPSGGGRQLKPSALFLLVSCWLIGYNGGVQAQYDPCSLCRDRQIITAGDSILEDGFAFVLDEALPCDAVQRMALAGSFTNIECALLRSYGSATECGCQDAPLTSPPLIDGTCGGGVRGNGVCADGTCCSQYGFCGATEEYCTTTCGDGNRGDGVCPDDACCSQHGYCGTADEYCTTTPPTRAPTIPTEEQSDAPLTSPPLIDGTCGGGVRGNGVCADGTCCSQYGFCGATEEYCTTTCGDGNRGDGVCPDDACCSQHGYCGTADEYCTTTPPTRAPTIPTEEQSGEVYVRLFPVENALTITSDYEAACAKFYQAALNLQQVSCEVVSSNIARRILQGGRFLHDASFTLDLLSWVTGTGPVFDDFQAALVDALNEDPDTFANELKITGYATSQLYFRSVDSVVAYNPDDEIPGPGTHDKISNHCTYF